MKTISLTLRVLARLLGYPDAELRAHLGQLRDALREEQALGSRRLAELDRLIDALGSPQALETEAGYVELFDRGRATALHLFEHVHGDSRDRGPAMVDLVQTYEQAGLAIAPGELPDHLAVVLEYASTQPAPQAREFLREIAHIVRAIFEAVLQRRSPHASALAAVLELAGEQAPPVSLADVAAPPARQSVDDAGLDQSWEEPAAFDGCSTRGQARPGQPQPIAVVRRSAGHRSAIPTSSGARA